jgi:predicted RNase H-like HicB family nuclease
MKTYYALVHKDEGSAFGISFPDLPGCFGAADEEADIHQAAVSALVFYAQDESNLPEPRPMPQIMADHNIKAELAQGAVLLAVPLIVVQRKARYNVMLDVDLVAGVDRQARTMGITRSDFLATATQDQLRSMAGAAIIRGNKAASAGSKVFSNRSGFRDEKSIAASVVGHNKTKDVSKTSFASKTGGRVIHDPKVSKEAKSAAASALAQSAPAKAAKKK